MSLSERPGVWFWTALLLAALASIVIVRVWSGWAGRPVTSAAADDHGRITADADSLTAMAHRMRGLQDESRRTRDQLTAAEADAEARRGEIEVIDRMLDSGRLTDCPAFLSEQTTVRALQKIIAEANSQPAPGNAPAGNLNTAALVAQERLRRKLQSIREEADEELKTLSRQAQALRELLARQVHELDDLGRELQRRLQSSQSSESPIAA